MANDPSAPQPPSNDDARVISLDAARARKPPPTEPQPPARDDHQPMLRLPPMTKALCAVMIICFGVLLLVPAGLADQITLQGGFIPARYSGDYAFDPAMLWSPFTHALLHGGWLHLALNTGMLMAFGAGLEKQRGARSLLILFIGSVLAGAIAQFIFYPDSLMPMIGASGGISGLFGAALMEMANRATGPAPLWAKLRHLLPFILVWVGISIFFGVFGMPGEDQPVAWAAHIGGFMAGMLMARGRAI